MFTSKFGVEIEMTGITRAAAALALEPVLQGLSYHNGGAYDTYSVPDDDGRSWKLVSDGSIRSETKGGSRSFEDFRVELVTPVLTYAEDMELLQNVVRALRKAGACVNDSCGIHIHLDGANQTVRSLKNWVNIVASKNDLLYKSLEVAPERLFYCQKVDADLVEACKGAKTMRALEAAWYRTYPDGRRGCSEHYHCSRYHFLNLHSFFAADHHTVELRGFNSTLHAGRVRSYVALALALNEQALTQRTARAAKVQTENDKFAMRTYLTRIGLVGDEFSNCREHLTANLTGCSAWRFGRPAAGAAVITERSLAHV